MFADIWSGAVDWADVFFLVAAILLLLEAVILFVRSTDVVPILRPVGLALVALGLLAL